MSLLSVSEVSFHYSSDAVLFEGASFSVNPGNRIAIVGANGAGKSTLLLLLAGLLEPAAGAITRRRSLAISIAEQDAGAGGDSLFEFILAGSRPASELRARIRDLEPLLADPRTAAEYAGLIHEYEQTGGYQAEAEAERTLCGLGFAPADFERPTANLSGGERTRASLARALSTPSDLLILDEPTNHLDIAGREWLEETLAARAGACVLTSHDRALLCSFARRIVEIDRGKVRVFEGTYEEYRHARALLDRQAWAAYEAFQRRKRAAESAAQRRDQLATKVAATPAGVRAGGARPFYARKAAKVARTARILRERVSDERAVEKPWEETPIDRLTFDNVARGGDVAVIAAGVAKSYGSRTLFRDLSFHVRRGGRLVIAGANGTGKTTLLLLIAGRIPPDAGEVRYGAHVEPALISQTLDTLDLRASPLEICGTGTRARTLLACLKLRPDCLNRPVSELSGGERTKVALAQMLTSGANLLLLDEPTNHLEIEAQEALEAALRNYPGAAIIVSHDRFFLDTLGDDVPCVRLG